MTDEQRETEKTPGDLSQHEENKKYTCDVCGAGLSRLSHLQRHYLLHAPDHQEAYRCPVCDKKYARKDVYQRHYRGVHQSDRTNRPNRRKKSCQRCIRYKLRCSRQVPCSLCSERRSECIYDRRPIHTGSVATRESQSTTCENFLPGSDGNGSQSVAESAGPARDMPGASLQYQEQTEVNDSMADLRSPVLDENAVAGAEQLDDQQPFVCTSHNVTHESFEHDTSLQVPFVTSPSAEAHHFEERPDHASLPLSGMDLMTSDSFDRSQQQYFDLGDFDSTIFRASRMDWLVCETDVSDLQTLNSPNNQFQTPPANGDSYQCLNHQRRAPCLDNKESWPGILDKGGNEQWPFDYTSNQGFRVITLPPLRQVMEQTVSHRKAIDKTLVFDLIKVLSAPYIPSLNDSPALEALPAVAFLGQLVKTYFDEFQSVLPVIHLPSWRIEKCPTALLAAIACIGATYSKAEGSSEVAALLAEITQRILFWTGQADTTSFRSPAYIAAHCFHQTYSLGSGNRRLYELADGTRGFLVTSLRGLGVLSSADGAEREDSSLLEFQQLKTLSQDSLERTWTHWRDAELKKRVAWAVFEFDCTLSTLTSKRGAFNISELPSRLPCSESLWEAHSAKAWMSMVGFANGPPEGKLLYPTIQTTIVGKPEVTSIPSWGRRLCLMILGRHLWDLRELEEAASTRVLGLPSLASAHQSTRSNLLHVMSTFNDSLSNPKSTAEVVNMNIACLLTHHAHLTNNAEAVDLVLFIFRNCGRTDLSTVLERELQRARSHLRNVFRLRAAVARRSVYHAATVVTVARECTIFTPCETMRVFLGLAFLLTYNKVSPLPSSCSLAMAAEDSVRLDELPWRRSTAEQARLERWIDQGDCSASFGPIPDISDDASFDALKAFATTSMKGLHVWGLSKKFCRVLQNFT